MWFVPISNALYSTGLGLSISPWLGFLSIQTFKHLSNCALQGLHKPNWGHWDPQSLLYTRNFFALSLQISSTFPSRAVSKYFPLLRLFHLRGKKGMKNHSRSMYLSRYKLQWITSSASADWHWSFHWISNEKDREGRRGKKLNQGRSRAFSLVPETLNALLKA